MFLLRGYKDLNKKLKNVKLLLIGQGTDGDPENTENDVRDYVVENGLCENVILTGQRSDVPDLLSIADVFCLTSQSEGLPISMLEAMSVGLPIVGTNVPGIRDVIRHRKNGFLVNLGDHEDLTNALYQLLSDEQLRRQYGQMSKRIVNESYSLSQCVARYQDLFLRLITN